MRLLLYGFWTIIGTGLAFIFLKTQSWSVKLIHPDRVKLSKWIVVGGAFIRWMLVFMVFFIALSDSVVAMLISFGAFMLSRMVMLVKLQGNIHIKSIRFTKME